MMVADKQWYETDTRTFLDAPEFFPRSGHFRLGGAASLFLNATTATRRCRPGKLEDGVYSTRCTPETRHERQ